jgi:hypothetical protein
MLRVFRSAAGTSARRVCRGRGGLVVQSRKTYIYSCAICRGDSQTLSTGSIHDDADAGSPSSIDDTVPRSSIGDRLNVLESGLKETNAQMVHLGGKIDLKMDALSAKFDTKFGLVDARFNQMEAKFDAKFSLVDARFNQMELLLKATAADILKQQKDNENRMLSRLLLAVSSYSCILCIIRPNGGM